MRQIDLQNDIEQLKATRGYQNQPEVKLVVDDFAEKALPLANQIESDQKAEATVLELRKQTIEKLKSIINAHRSKVAQTKIFLPDREIGPANLSEIKELIGLDWEENKEVLRSFNLIQEDPHKADCYFYQSDYDGQAEADGQGENWQGRVFEMPNLNDLINWLTFDQIKLYQNLFRQGLEPKLILIPLGYKIKTLNEKRSLLKLPPAPLWKNISDAQLIYDPEPVMQIKEGQQILTIKGKSKSAWIREHQGWQIKIVAMKSELPVNEQIIYGDPIKKTDARNYVEQHQLHLIESQKQGFGGLSWESYLTALLMKIKSGQVLGDWEMKKTFTILAEVGFKRSPIVSQDNWFAVRFNPNGFNVVYQFKNIRWRPTVDIAKKISKNSLCPNGQTLGQKIKAWFMKK